MSESATFSQSASPTAGLTNYDLEPVPKELYPSPGMGLVRKRPAAWRKRFFSRGRLKKDSTTMTDHTIAAMVDTLRMSVTTINGSNSADRDTLLAKSFDEFKAALSGEVENALAKAAPEEPLYKGLGCIGRVCNLVGSLASQIETIQRGYDSWSSGKDGGPPDNADPASPELVAHLEDLLAHAECLMRIAVNEHCEPMEDGDDGHGMHVVMVPVHDGGGEVAVKTYLPTDLAKFATDPAAIESMLVDVGFGVLENAGVDTEMLGKALSGEGLAKDAGLMGGAQATPGDPSAPDAGGADIGDLDNADPLDVLARLNALSMIVIDQLKQAVDGTNEPSDPTGEDPSTGAQDPDSAAADGTGADAPGAGGSDGNPSPDDAQKVAPTGDLAKGLTDEALEKVLLSKGIDVGALSKMADDNIALRAQIAELEELSGQLLKRAEPPKAPLVTSGAVAKTSEDALGAAGAQPATEDLSKLSPLDRALKLTKLQQQTTGQPYRGL